MTKTTDEAVEWLIDVVQQAIEDGRATADELEDWLLAAMALEDLAQARRIEPTPTVPIKSTYIFHP